MSLVLRSPAFADGHPIPRRYTGDGEDLSPPLSWLGLPPQARAAGADRGRSRRALERAMGPLGDLQIAGRRAGTGGRDPAGREAGIPRGLSPGEELVGDRRLSGTGSSQGPWHASLHLPTLRVEGRARPSRGARQGWAPLRDRGPCDRRGADDGDLSPIALDRGQTKVPDSRGHRGADPRDAEAFGLASRPALRAAVSDLSWLLGHGYAPASSLKLVGDRWNLTERQRMAVRRSACSDDDRTRREAARLSASERRRDGALDRRLQRADDDRIASRRGNRDPLSGRDLPRPGRRARHLSQGRRDDARARAAGVAHRAAPRAARPVAVRSPRLEQRADPLPGAGDRSRAGQ